MQYGSTVPPVGYDLSVGALLLAACSLLVGCSTVEKPVSEAPPPTPVVFADGPQQKAKLSPPQMNEIQDALKRVFKESVVIDTSRAPAFIAADFNGDLSEDIAVALTPAPEKLAALNEELPGWILRDPFGKVESRSPRLRIADKEQLLAVIHGYGAGGWRDSQATQTYLLKNVAGSNMEAQSPKEVAAANRDKSQPAMRGEVLSEVVAGKSGYLYYDRATYSWYDPKTFKAEPERGTVHGRSVAVTKK